MQGLQEEVAQLGIDKVRKRHVARREKRLFIMKPVLNTTRAASNLKISCTSRSSRLSGGMRKQQQKAWAAEVKGVREEMEKQTSLLEQSREAALLEKQVVD